MSTETKQKNSKWYTELIHYGLVRTILLHSESCIKWNHPQRISKNIHIQNQKTLKRHHSPICSHRLTQTTNNHGSTTIQTHLSILRFSETQTNIENESSIHRIKSGNTKLKRDGGNGVPWEDEGRIWGRGRSVRDLRSLCQRMVDPPLFDC